MVLFAKCLFVTRRNVNKHCGQTEKVLCCDKTGLRGNHIVDQIKSSGAQNHVIFLNCFQQGKTKLFDFLNLMMFSFSGATSNANFSASAHLVREDHINGVNGCMLHWVRLPSSDGLWGLSCVYTMTPSHLPLSCQPAIPAYFSRGQLVFHCIIWASSVTPSLSVRVDESDESVWVRRVYLTEGATTQSWSR